MKKKFGIARNIDKALIESPNENYTPPNEPNYFIHQSNTVTKKGARWGKFDEYSRKLKAKWPGAVTTSDF